MQEIRPKQVANYVLMPGIMPRLRELFGSGFGHIAFLMAYIFQAVRLLPMNHPYLMPDNVGTYGIRHVFAQAADHIVLSRKNIDQIVIFIVMAAGFLLLILQFALLFASIIIKPVMAAGPIPFTGLFTTTLPENDIAFQLLDKVFGIPGFFNSSFAPAGAPLPFNAALQALLQFYNLAILIVGVLIFMYYVLVVVAETAQTGTPFGRRFNHIWAPIRLVVAVGLLVPLSWGLNSAQYITLMAAKMGSGFATNGWLLFNSTLTNGFGVGDDNSMFSRPSTPDTWPIVKFVLMARTCKESYERLNGTVAELNLNIQPYLVKPPLIADDMPAGYAYADALTFYRQSDVIIRFGHKDDAAYPSEPGGVFPYCGEIVVPTTVATQDGYLVGPYRVQEAYFNAIVTFLWNSPSARGFASVMASRMPSNGHGGGCNTFGVAGLNCDPAQSSTGATPEFTETLRTNWQNAFVNSIGLARDAMMASEQWAIPVELLERGWAGAGIWYNRIAEINGAFFSAVWALPIPNMLPYPMQQVLDAKRKAAQNVSGPTAFNPYLPDGRDIQLTPITFQVALVLHEAYATISNDDALLSTEVKRKNNFFSDAVNFIFGLNGLWALRENIDIHPLAQLVGVGKSLVDATVRNIFAASVFSFGGGLFDTQDNGIKALSKMGASFMMLVATITMTAGFILYYILPFMPFMYFFFAVGAWLKTVFEAMVGVPLWALAHLRIDGNGLPGDHAMGGYYMIFEIFIRPILTVFGLIASLIVFAAIAKVLHQIWPLVVSNLTGFDNNPCDPGAGACKVSDPIVAATSKTNALLAELGQFKRSHIDEFFFTILYTMIMYMVGTSCFKLITLIPQGILRWMGAGVQAFSDNLGDPAQGLTAYAGYGAATMTKNMASAVVGGSEGLGKVLNRTMFGDKNADITKAGQGRQADAARNQGLSAQQHNPASKPSPGPNETAKPPEPPKNKP